MWVLAKQLYFYRNTGRSFRTLLQFRTEAIKHMIRQQQIHYAYKFGDAEIVVIDLCQHVTHQMI
ncbi:Uncharacterised protein [Vibrio cholerae]|uniref:Uncharacterized protein n=1 Tax=Vibrio cholerae TaxID=666 RepID=A0A656ASR1_VIBCL|nr:Uncharacterised protein [Vibrio cholerae]CSD33105.1 Uncharacterised protein [Vibrio cholerae]